jgi:hypothetical protein
MRIAAALPLLLACAAACPAAEHQAPAAPKPLPSASADPLSALPTVARVRPQAVEEAAGDELAPGIRRVRGRHVALEGVMNIDQGPVDGLEVLACLKDGKIHETLIRLDTTIGQLVKAACIESLGLTVDGQPAEEGTGQPARGIAIALEVQWRGDQGWLGVPASALVRDRVTDTPYPALPYVWTGSRFLTLHGSGPDGQPAARQQFMLDSTKSVAVNFDEPDALFASPFPGAVNDTRFETNSSICPPPGTRIRLVVRRCELPLTLALADDARLSHAGQVLDDAALSALLAAHYGAGAKPALRALGVQVERATNRRQDIAARTRLLAAAANAKAWVVPVFVVSE